MSSDLSAGDKIAPNTEKEEGLPELRNGAILSGQRVRIRHRFGWWACLDAPFPGSWINLRVLGSGGIVPLAASDHQQHEEQDSLANFGSPDPFSSTIPGAPASKVSSENSPNGNRSISARRSLSPNNTLDHEELNELRDHAAVAIHHVQELEELAWRGKRILAQARIREGVVMRYRDRTEADAETLSVHWKRSLNKLRTLFDELALGFEGERLSEDSDPSDDEVGMGLDGGRITRKRRKRKKRKRKPLPAVRAATGPSSLSQRFGIVPNNTFGGAGEQSGRSSWLQTQEQNGVWAVSPPRLAKTTLAMAAKHSAGKGRVRASRSLLKLFARLQAVAKRPGRSNLEASEAPLEWVRSVLPKRVFHIFRVYAKVSKSTLTKIQSEANVAKSSPNRLSLPGKSGGVFRHDVSGARVTVYHFPLDAESHDLENGRVVYEGWTGKDGKVCAECAPGATRWKS